MQAAFSIQKKIPSLTQGQGLVASIDVSSTDADQRESHGLGAVDNVVAVLDHLHLTTHLEWRLVDAAPVNNAGLDGVEKLPA